MSDLDHNTFRKIEKYRETSDFTSFFMKLKKYRHTSDFTSFFIKKNTEFAKETFIYQ